MVDSYYLFQYHLQNNCQPEVLLIIKNCILLFSMVFVCVVTRARFVDLRSRATLKILEARSFTHDISSLLEINRAPNLLDKIIEHTDYKNSLPNLCVSDDLKWIDVSQIMHFIVRTSFITTEKLTIDIKKLDSNCICKILKKDCLHMNKTNSTSINLGVTYWPARVFMEFSNNSLEEYFTKIYLMHMNKLHFNHEFLPIDVVFSPSLTWSPPISKVDLESFSMDASNLSQFRGHPFYGSFLVSALQIFSNIDGSGIQKATSEDIQNYRNSLPCIEVNSLSVDSSYEESQIWIKLAVQLAYYSQDITAVCHTTTMLVKNYLYIEKNYAVGIDELDKLIQFLYMSLSLLPRISSNIALRKFIQSTIVREKSVLIQYKKHVLAGLTTFFYPGQLMSVIIDGTLRDVIYVSFEYISKPIYITSIDSLGGACWSNVNCDLSLISSWLSVSLDNFHMQYNITGTTNLALRFLFHAIRTEEYSFAQFLYDLRARDKIVIT